MKILAILLTLLYLLVLDSASMPAVGQTVGGNTSITAGVASSNVALPASTATFPVVFVYPVPGTTIETFIKLGNSSVTAANTDMSVPLLGLCIGVGSQTVNTNLAAISASGTVVLRILQMSTCPPR